MVNQGDRRALEDHWRQRLKDAELRLYFARGYLREVQREFPPGDIPNEDGNYAQRHATRAENAALVEYRRILQIFSDLTVRGKIPDEERVRLSPAPQAPRPKGLEEE